MKKILFTVFSCALAFMSYGQSHKEIIKKEFEFEKISGSNVFLLANINGAIEAEGYDGDKIMLEAEMFIKAKTDERLERAKEKISLGVLDRYDSILVYIKGPCGSNNVGVRSYGGQKVKWSYYWNDCSYSYDFKVNFKIKIPRALNIYLSTINDGHINVNGVDGTLDLHNVNGDISAAGIKKYTYVHSVNGDINLDHVGLPSPHSSFYTLNGDIKAYFPSSLEANVTFKSFNGDIYTDFDGIEQKPMLLAKNDSEKVKGTSFKLESRSVISFGGGGSQLDFETFNGDVYIKKK